MVWRVRRISLDLITTKSSSCPLLFYNQISGRSPVHLRPGNYRGAKGDAVDIVVDNKYLESVAYHEAGHAIVAAAQGLPILREGVRLDRAGCGLMCYRFRNPDLSIQWKEAVVVSFAGLPSQQLIYPDCPTVRSQDDETSALSYMMAQSLEGQDLETIKSVLRDRSRFLVQQYSEAIKALGAALWAKQWVDREIDWTPFPKEKAIGGREVVLLANQFGIKTEFVDESGLVATSSDSSLEVDLGRFVDVEIYMNRP